MKSYRWWLALLDAAGVLLRRYKQRAALEPVHKTLLDRARQAEDDFRFDQALQLWDELRRADPTLVFAHAGVGRVLSSLGRHAEALAVLDAACERFPDSVDLALCRVRVLQTTGEFDRALSLSRDLRARFPGEPGGYEGMGKSLRGLGRFDESDAVLDEARRRFPNNLGLAVEYTANADVRGDWDEVLRRSEALMRDFSFAPMAHACLGSSLKRVKRYDDADAVFRTALARFPADSNLAMNYAWVADDKGDLEEALRRWTTVNERFGRNPRARSGYLESRGRAELARLDAEGGEGPHAAPPPAFPALPMDEQEAGEGPLFERFQGLGTNCEFGFVQRHFGAEPMGLLRWAGIDYDKLVYGLNHDFEGVGGPERTRLDLNPSNQEYYTTDTFYGLSMHTFVIHKEGIEADLYKKMSRRLTFLRQKLLDDLQSGEKIFVFSTDEPRSDEDCRVLHQALRRHGPGQLLFVRVADEGERVGDVTVLEDGLARGLIDRPGLRNGHWSISFPIWLELCGKADRLFAATAPAEPATVL